VFVIHRALQALSPSIIPCALIACSNSGFRNQPGTFSSLPCPDRGSGKGLTGINSENFNAFLALTGSSVPLSLTIIIFPISYKMPGLPCQQLKWKKYIIPLPAISGVTLWSSRFIKRKWLIISNALPLLRSYSLRISPAPYHL